MHADARERGLIRDRGQLADFLLVNEPGLGDDGSTVLPLIAPSHLPLGIVGEGDRVPLAVAQGSGVRATHGPQLLLVQSLEFVEGSLEEHLFRASREAGTLAVVHRDGPNCDLVDGVHPFGGESRTVEDAVGHPDPCVGVGATRIRIVAITDQGDLFVLDRQDTDVSGIETFSRGSNGQVTRSLADVAHDATVVAVDGEHVALLILDFRDCANDEVGNLHRTSNQSPDNLVKVVISISSF